MLTDVQSPFTDKLSSDKRAFNKSTYLQNQNSTVTVGSSGKEDPKRTKISIAGLREKRQNEHRLQVNKNIEHLA